MRLALVSDQHGNDVAFRAALEDVERLDVEEIVCLGDVVQGGSEPAQTLDRLAALGCETVLGNADAFLLEVPADSPEPAQRAPLPVQAAGTGTSALLTAAAHLELLVLDPDSRPVAYASVVCGAEDLLTPVPEAEALVRGIAGSRLEVIPAAGHLSSVENPEGFNDVVGTFLRELH